MNTTSEKKIRRIERISMALRGLCSALLVIIGISTLVAAGAALAGRLRHFQSFGSAIDLSGTVSVPRIAVTLVVLTTGVVALYALYHLRQLLGNYSRREIFTVGSAARLRRFGVGCVLWCGVELLWACLAGFAQAPAAAPVLLHLDAAIIGTVIVGVSWFAEMAAELREENDLTI